MSALTYDSPIRRVADDPRSRAAAPASPRPAPAEDAAPTMVGGGIDLVSVPVHGRPPPRPLAISDPAGPDEKEADDAAERVLRGERVRVGTASAQRLARQCKGFPELGDHPAPGAGPKVAAALRISGSPLDGALRSRFEHGFGRSFAGVRVHADAAAAAAVRAVKARAFTVGPRIAFGAGEYAPRTPAGQHLIAHELAHVAQNRGSTGTGILYRFPYETKGISLSRQNVINLTGSSYWVRRTTDRYHLTWDSRLADNPEERDAVLSALWAQNPPETVPAPSELIVPVQQRPAAGGGTAPPALLYRFRFTPPANPGDKPKLLAEFVAAGPGAIPVQAPAPKPGSKPGKLKGFFSGFTGGREAFIAAFPQEHAQLETFLATAPTAVDQVVKTVTTSGGVTTHRSIFHVVRTAADPREPLLTLVSQAEPAAATAPPADYRLRDAADFLLEGLRAMSRPEADRLGAVNLPAGLPADERLAVNLAVYAYFGSGAARNTEVDAKVPVGVASRVVLFTLRFQAANNVDVKRIGELGPGPGAISMDRIDVTRAHGFPGATADDPTLRSWWTKRYPAGGALSTPKPAKVEPTAAGSAATPAAPADPALIAEMSSLVAAGSTQPAWLKGNYGLTVMSAKATADHLKAASGVPAALVADTLDFPAKELSTIEIAFQTLSKAALAKLRGVRLGRKSVGILRVAKKWQTSPDLGGLTITTSGSPASTILYFDRMHLNDDALFRGSSAANVLPDVSMILLHEAGHATAAKPGVQAAFNAWRKKNSPEAPTWYAGQDPDNELFPEAYALFHSDPHFLCGAAPLLYEWFAELSRTGTPPGANAKLVPGACPP